MVAKEKDDGFIRWRCKACGQRLKVKETREGGDVMPCPRCGEIVNVPMGNIAEIAKGTEMAETGDPGRLNVDPELLMKRLRGDEKRTGPGSAGAAPTLGREGWSAQAAFGRVEELDQLAAGLVKIDQDSMGTVQRIYRSRELSTAERRDQIRAAGKQRHEDVRQLVQKRLAALRQQAASMQAKQERLNRSELDHLARLKRGAEAIELYARYMLGGEA